MNVLVLNAGSSSLKYQLVDPDTTKRVVAGTIEVEGDAHREAFERVLAAVADHRVDAVGHRVVHGGDTFIDAARIDDAVVSAIESMIPLAPLHNPANLAGIRLAREFFADIPHIAVFDTAFHVRMPRRARTYAIDREYAEAHSIRRFGFHGTSHRFVAKRAAQHVGRPLNEVRIVSLHLGNGASACAIEYGHSVETSMGLTPLEGLVMGTRSGDIDPGVVLSLARELGIDETDKLLNRRSGLLGLSGISNDLREIQRAAADGNDRARLAINVFAHRVRKYIGAYAAVMGGLDIVVLTGGIGENGAEMRRRILQRLDFLGISIDEDSNLDAKVDDDSPVYEISSPHSRVRSLVIATNEELQIAVDAAAIAKLDKEPKTRKSIPIAISARHVHLDRAAMDTLFGPGTELTPYKPLSQPGQFASEERVTIVGPRGKIERVRVLGPLRGATQVEVSRTDEFLLGVDAPIRQSGSIKDSAPISLEGPRGSIQLTEGLICAWRHIHMHPDDAEAYGVKDGDEVEVAVEGGPRDLIFGDVLVRVSPKYALEMHIDTDEANAAELSGGAEGTLLSEIYVAPEGEARAVLKRKR